MDLLHHEVLEAFLLSRRCIPVDLYRCLLDDITVEVIECGLACFEACHLEIVDIVDAPGVLEDSGYV